MPKTTLSDVGKFIEEATVDEILQVLDWVRTAPALKGEVASEAKKETGQSHLRLVR